MEGNDHIGDTPIIHLDDGRKGIKPEHDRSPRFFQCTQVHCASDWFGFLAGKAGVF